MSVARPGGSRINVKKTRAPAKKEPVARAPKTAKKPASTTNGPPAQPTSSTAAAGASSTDKPDDGMDKLAGEMKKIKITVITKAQREARERERQAREKLSEAATISVPPPGDEKEVLAGPAPPADISASHPSTVATANAQHLPSPTPSPAPQPTQLQTPTNPSTPSIENMPTPTTTATLTSPPPTDPRRVPLPASSPPPPPTPDVGRSPTATHTFIPYQPEHRGGGPGVGPPPAAVLAEQQQQHQQLQWLPPNVCATPMQSPTKRGDLPVFTSTGVIPFAPAANVPAHGHGQSGEENGSEREGGEMRDGKGAGTQELVPESPHY